MKPEPDYYPDVVISGSLAMALVDALEYASLRTHEPEDTARAELDAMRDALDVEIRDASHGAFPQRWAVGIPPEDVQEGTAVLDEVPRPVLSVQQWTTAHMDEADSRLLDAIHKDVMRRRKDHGRSYLR